MLGQECRGHWHVFRDCLETVEVIKSGDQDKNGIS